MEDLKTKLAVDREVQKALAEQKLRLETEHARILQIIDADERESELLKLDITNNILTLHCPRCKIAFNDFSGMVSAQIKQHEYFPLYT